MKIFLTGATGLLGRAFVRQFTDYGILHATAFSRAAPPVHKLDLRDAAAVAEQVAAFQPDLLIHSAAERRPDICENDHAATDALNVAAVTTLAEAAKATGALLLYISTDYVFDGTQPPYSVDAAPNPLNYYGRSKLAGEAAALASGARVCILRVPILYGPVESLEESPVTLIASMLTHPAEQDVDDWAVRYPTHVDDVAGAVRRIAVLLEEGKSLPVRLHFSGSEAITKYEMARMIGEACGLNADHLTPDPDPPAGAPRPHNSQLDNSLIENLIAPKRQPFARAIGGIITPHLK